MIDILCDAYLKIKSQDNIYMNLFSLKNNILRIRRTSFNKHTTLKHTLDYNLERL